MISRKFICYNFAAKMHGKPFNWQRNNCALLAATLYDKLEGGRFWRSQVIKVTSTQQAVSVCKDKPAYKIMIDNGFKVIDADDLRLGDIIYAYKNNLECLHIYYGDLILSSGKENGVAFCKTSEILKLDDAICLSKGVT